MVGLPSQADLTLADFAETWGVRVSGAVALCGLVKDTATAYFF
jgi:hypothetical protein